MAGARALPWRIVHAAAWRLRVIETIAALAFARALIRFIPFARWRRLLGPLGVAGREEAVAVPLDESQQRLVRAVRREIMRWAPRLPFEAVCLPQAMAARWVLGRRGVDGRITIGARTGSEAQRPVDLHAWLMVGDFCVTGDTERRTYEAFVRRASVPAGSAARQ